MGAAVKISDYIWTANIVVSIANMFISWRIIKIYKRK